MRTETYLRAYFACRDRLEFHRLEGRTRRRLVRQERKLEGRLIYLAELQGVGGEAEAHYTTLWGWYQELRRERVFLWIVVLSQLAVLVFLALAKIAWPWI